MKKLLTTLPILLGFAALAEYDYIRLPSDGTPVTVELGGLAVAAQAFDNVNIYRIDSKYETREVVDSTSETNTTYCLSYTNAVGNVVTNATDYDIAPLPAGYQYIAYWTNTVVTTTATTNWVTVLDYATTNLLGETVDNIGGPLNGVKFPVIGEFSPDIGQAYLPPGTQLCVDESSADAIVIIQR